MTKQSIRFSLILILGIFISSSICFCLDQKSKEPSDDIWKIIAERIKSTISTFPETHLAAVVETVAYPECEPVEGESECRQRVRVVETLSSGSELSTLEAAPGEYYVLSGQPTEPKEMFQSSRFIFVGAPIQNRPRLLAARFAHAEASKGNIEKVKEIIKNLQKE